jgi:hypothetical protein
MLKTLDGAVKMNREYLLDGLDGLKALIFSLLPAGLSGSIACVPMTTDGPWNDAEKSAFTTAVGIPSDRTFWSPGDFVNVPSSGNSNARSKWVDAVAAIAHLRRGKRSVARALIFTGYWQRHIPS